MALRLRPLLKYKPKTPFNTDKEYKNVHDFILKVCMDKGYIENPSTIYVMMDNFRPRSFNKAYVAVINELGKLGWVLQ